MYGTSPFFSNPVFTKTITGAATTGGPITLFTIAGGRVKVLSLVARVTTALGANATTVLFRANPTTGADTDLSVASVDIQSAPIGAKLAITGEPSDVTRYVASGGAIPLETTPAEVDIGTIELVIASGGDATGRVSVTVEWSPLESGTTLT